MCTGICICRSRRQNTLITSETWRMGLNVRILVKGDLSFICNALIFKRRIESCVLLGELKISLNI